MKQLFILFMLLMCSFGLKAQFENKQFSYVDDSTFNTLDTMYWNFVETDMFIPSLDTTITMYQGQLIQWRNNSFQILPRSTSVSEIRPHFRELREQRNRYNQEIENIREALLELIELRNQLNTRLLELRNKIQQQ